MAKIIGIDYGEKRIGLALADSKMKLAVPLEIIENRGIDFVLEKINEVINRDEIEKVVVGMPVSLSGEEGKQADVIKEFVNILNEKLNIEVLTEDERLSSKMVDSLARDNKKPKDSVSAMIILQSYLDKL